jgi:hypothetical protein
LPRSDREADAFYNDCLPFRPGDDLLATVKIAAAREDPGHFWPDGMIRVSGREYSGLKESPCYQRGEMSCISCHAMHLPARDRRPLKEWANDQLGAEMEGNQACVQCHADYRDVERLQAHTHHVPGSTGSRCYNCHMPHTTYGLLKAMRSHQITSPDASVSAQFGRPNACNLCHLDKTLQWTATHLKDWYEIEPPRLNESERTISAAAYQMLAGDALQRAIVAWHAGWKPAQDASGTDWLPPYLAQLLLDPYDAVRFISARSLHSLPGYGVLMADYDYLANEDERSAVVVSTLQQWRNRDKAPLPPDSSLLFTIEGQPRLEVWTRLIDSRRVGPIEIQE